MITLQQLATEADEQWTKSNSRSKAVTRSFSLGETMIKAN